MASPPEPQAEAILRRRKSIRRSQGLLVPAVRTPAAVLQLVPGSRRCELHSRPGLRKGLGCAAQSAAGLQMAVERFQGGHKDGDLEECLAVDQMFAGGCPVQVVADDS